MKSYIQQFSTRPRYFAEELYFKRYHGDSRGTILEIGCSVGHHMEFGSERKVGLDFDIEALRIARGKGFTVACADVQKGLPFRGDSFSSIDCQHVVEHVTNPFFLAQECLRVLAPGGAWIVVTPNVEEIGFEFYVDYTHIRPFTRRSLLNLAGDAGFADARVEYLPKGVPLSKTLHANGWLSVESALSIQTTLKRLGYVGRETLVLIARKSA